MSVKSVEYVPHTVARQEKRYPDTKYQISPLSANDLHDIRPVSHRLYILTVRWGSHKIMDCLDNLCRVLSNLFTLSKKHLKYGASDQVCAR